VEVVAETHPVSRIFFRQVLKALHGGVNRKPELVHSATGTAVGREIRRALNQF